MLALAPLAGHAAVISLPSDAELRAETVEAAGTYPLPTGPWQDGSGVAAEAISGKVTRQAWRIGGTGLSSYQILLNLREQLIDQGYAIRFECEAQACGGFDFRYGTEVVGEPDMHVNLGDFHFLSASKAGNAPDHVSLLVSRSASAAFVQLVQVGELEAAPVDVEPMTSTKAEPGTALPAEIEADIGPAMEQVGRFVLADLVFATGSSELGPGQFTSLSELASYLIDHPARRVALVGHTDAEGSLAGNISLSKRRAASVMDRLIGEYGVPAAQLEAEGIGYLAPIASNQTDEGRTRNRRVEAILISTE
ncbi:OmpA family protein [Sinisalibacter aestuarii]|uniref:Membrane protein n=1 Tax=Sinisalibacter aestuarii TaxID=2949426 RepID=A0ABQ5LUX1_9RHOB|nr:OmpA family protein [Sinisalibacter aestuarii]GKY88784.1 membrane protein [Sinisalibacter aestuarii]